MKFRKRSVIVDAVCFDDYFDESPVEFRNVLMCENAFSMHERFFIQTLEGDMYVNKGDWIIKGVNGEFYPCKPHIFEKTYEKVEE